VNPKDFCYWLQAFFDNVHPATLDGEQLAVIREHLQQVFHTAPAP